MAFYTQQHQDNSLPIPILIFPFSSADVCVYLFYAHRCVLHAVYGTGIQRDKDMK